MTLHHILSALTLLCLTSICSAGGWSYDFEREEETLEFWELAPGATAEQYLTQEYNHTVNTITTRSVEMSSGGPNTRIAAPHSFTASTGGNSAYFYDDGSDLASFYAGVNLKYSLGGSNTTTSLLGVGVRDTVQGGNTEYLLLHNNQVTPTGIERTPGWHRVQVSWVKGEPARVMLDKTSLLTASALNAYEASTFEVEAHPVSGPSMSAETRVWLDDVSARFGVVPQDFTENFAVNDPLPYWEGNPFTASQLIDGARSYTPGSGSLTTSATVNTSADAFRMVALHDNPGYVSTWFYDDGAQPKEFSVAFLGSMPGSLGRTPFSVALGVKKDSLGITPGDYILSISIDDEPTTRSTGISRTVGWHHVLIGSHAGGPGLRMILDDTDISDVTFPHLGTISDVGIASSLFGSNEPPVPATNQVWLDDLNYYFNQYLPAPEPSSADHWFLFE